MVNGVRISKMEWEGRLTMMDQFIKDIGKAELLMDKDERYSLVDKYLMDSGIKASFKAKGYSLEAMVHLIQDNGFRISSMAMVIKNGKMA